MGKHAFLILAHKANENFKTLIALLDNKRNDLFIHMDKKNVAYCEKDVRDIVKYSSVYHTKRATVTWGDYSIVRAELALLQLAIKTGKYDYYHLLSGADLPIKSIAYIHKFFDDNSGFEFVGMVEDSLKYRYRIDRFYFFQNKIGREQNDCANLFLKFDRYIKLIYRKLRIKRNRSLDLWYGSQWFSITDAFARYVVRHKMWIRYHFKYTLIPDELFIQSLLAKSPYKKNVYHIELNSSYKSAMRYIDWKRGRPYVFCEGDYQELKDSKMLFARKFDSDMHPELTRKLFTEFKVF